MAKREQKLRDHTVAILQKSSGSEQPLSEEKLAMMMQSGNKALMAT